MSSHPHHLLLPSSPSPLNATVTVGGNGGFYLRHGYLEGELTFMSFVTLFREASHSSQALSREPIREAIYGGVEFSTFSSSPSPCLPITKLLSAVAEDADPADEGQAMYEHLAKHAQKLWRITEEEEEERICNGRRNGQEEERGAAATKDDILFKVAIPYERAKLWQKFILTTSPKHKGEEREDAAGTKNAEQEGESTVAADNTCNSIFKEEPEEARTVTCGVANTDRNFVTLTVADGQGLVAWLRCCALYCHNELLKEMRVLAFEAKEKVIREFDDEAAKRALTAQNGAAYMYEDNETDTNNKNGEDEKTENLLQLRQSKIDAAVREALENFVPPPRPPLVLTAYSKVREQRVHLFSHAKKSAAEDDSDDLVLFGDDNTDEKKRNNTVEVAALRSYHESLRYRPTHATLMRIELAEKLFSSGLTSSSTCAGPRGLPPIVLRNTKNDNFIVLPNPCEETVRVSWASLIQQSRHVWGVLRPIFQYLVRESGVRSLMTIANPEQFSVWKRQLSAALLTANTESAYQNTIVFELRVYEYASKEEVSTERRPLPATPIQLDSMLNVRPPFFISTAPLTRGLTHIPRSSTSSPAQRKTISDGPHASTNSHTLSTQEALEVRARASADAAERYTYKQLHSSLSLEVVNILNRIETYTRNGGGLSAVPPPAKLSTTKNVTANSPTREANEDGSPSIPSQNEARGMISAWDRVGIDEQRSARMSAYERKMSPQPSVTRSALDYASYAAQPPTSPVGYNEARGLAALHRRKLEKLLGSTEESDTANQSVPQAQQSPQKNNSNPSGFLPHITAPSSTQFFSGQTHHQGPPLPLKSHRDALLKAASGEAHTKDRGDKERESVSSFLPSPRGTAGGNYSLRNLTIDDLTSPYRVHSSSSSSAPSSPPRPFADSGRSSAYYYSVVLTDPFGPKYTIPALHGQRTAATGSGEIPIGEFELHGGKVARGNTHRINGPPYREGGDERGGLAAAQRHLKRLTQNAERSASLAAAVAVTASSPPKAQVNVQ